MLKKYYKGEAPMGLNDDSAHEQKSKEQEELLKKIKDLEETLKANNMVMEEYQKSFEERL